VKWKTPARPVSTTQQTEPSVVAQQPTRSPLTMPMAPASPPFRPPAIREPLTAPSVVTQPSVAPLPPPVTSSILPPASPPPPVNDGFDPLGSFFEHADDTLPEIEEWEAQTEPIISPIVPYKCGIFQRAGVSGSWLEGGTDGRAPAIATLSAFSTIAVPFPIREWPLYITSGGDVRWVDGPRNPDLPPRLYDTYVDFTWKLRITQRSSHVFSVAPGYYSDFQQNSAHAFRVTGKWYGSYDVVKNRVTLLTGTTYLGRDDLKLLPTGGLVFTPNDWSRFEAVFPNPRASLKVRCTESFEDWIYLGADFYNGQTYAIQRANGASDRVTLLDNRGLIGYERRRQGGAGWNVEGGWVFDRDVQYRNTPGQNYSPEPTYYVRAGFSL
jgi:hypothetical protein